MIIISERMAETGEMKMQIIPIICREKEMVIHHLTEGIITMCANHRIIMVTMVNRIAQMKESSDLLIEIINPRRAITIIQMAEVLTTVIPGTKMLSGIIPTVIIDLIVKTGPR